MASPLEFHPSPNNPMDMLRTRLDSAPQEHAEAILAAYDILQLLHDRGVLEVIRGALAAGDDLLDTVVNAINTPEAVRALRNLMFWRSVLGQIEPLWFQGIFEAIPEGLSTATAQRDDPITLWRILRRGVTKDSLRGLTAAVDFLESFGRHLNSLEHSVPLRSANPPARS